MNQEVTEFLDGLNHPLRAEIEQLRKLILNAEPTLTENVKWNGPNYCIGDADRITMKIQPPKQIQLIFHRGVKKLEQPKERLLATNSKLLVWKENDRAVASFKNQTEIENSASELRNIIKDWIKVTME
ncbi:DUF1801 domain-containing protein [Flagellimonas pelagia]|uniref:DUF1801 domain-containing protein n=1 Tax=Flagellimonas pelagia TaxID=2306998 RepID=A0A3A1NNN4_9FLAO|nr:DUF1801 domain-containing protein [Allomuricauda maritima]RIV45921.1 DUF1801 domain-containing protein [Allomuricauda maritima]TXJ98682.1 DUF1801 domain-containing protein [Allomuricauda maritima]